MLFGVFAGKKRLKNSDLFSHGFSCCLVFMLSINSDLVDDIRLTLYTFQELKVKIKLSIMAIKYCLLCRVHFCVFLINGSPQNADSISPGFKYDEYQAFCFLFFILSLVFVKGLVVAYPVSLVNVSLA